MSAHIPTARTISRNIREGYYQGCARGRHERGAERFALRTWAPTDPWTCDKSNWGRGDWQHEPDRLNFLTDEGFDAAILRARHSGSLCGYVGVPFGHPWWGLKYSDSLPSTPEQLAAPVNTDKISLLSLFCMAADGLENIRIDCTVQVHGGLTYSARGWRAAGEDARCWYFGFDCAHYGDASPAYDRMWGSDGQYRDIDYVKEEIAALSRQLAGK
jgi:hypothetical protein